MTHVPKRILLFFLLSWSSTLVAQENRKSLRTSIFAGIYQYGKNIEKDAIGAVTIYPETDTTVLFYMYVNRGAPSYNMGEIYGRMSIKSFQGLYHSQSSNLEVSCKFTCDFKGDRIEIVVQENQDDCGFGYGVYLDGNYKRKSHRIPKYFVDMTESKIYFKETKPESWPLK
jgi:hypothetical protein